MRIRDLLVVVDGEPAAQHRVRAAIGLAGSLDAHLTALALVPEPNIPPIAGISLPAEVMAEHRERALAEAQSQLDAATALASAEGVSMECRHEIAPVDQWPYRLARQARHADLTVIGQPNPDSEMAAEAELLVEASFMRSGRPALVVPYIGARELPPKRAIICWDGSREASRALHDSLPLIEHAEAVTLLIIDPDKQGSRLGQMPGADTATHLARHGIEIEIKSVTSGNISVGDIILDEVSDLGADVVVMGAYGHSRLREMIFGGATKRLLESMTVPALMSH